MRVWRVGHRSGPCDFAPRHIYAWTHRFDDPERVYRTLYCADGKKTCLREVLADLRPKTAAVADFLRLFGPDPSVTGAIGVVTRGWRRKNVLARARVSLIAGRIVYVESRSVRGALERRLSEFLEAEGIARLNVKELRSRKRHVTQRISRALFEGGDAGVEFRSHLDGRPCYALIETRAKLVQLGKALSLTHDLAELKSVCEEFSLRLAP
jgi:hypothetical protein